MLHRARLRRKAALRKILRLGLQLLQIVLVPFLVGWFMYQFFGLDLIVVDQAMAVQGQVTKCDVNRQHFNWYLNNEESARYDFWSFEPADPATRHLITADSLAFIVATGDSSGYTYYNTLAYYLSIGARLRKVANSPYITVEQDHRITRWKYQP